MSCSSKTLNWQAQGETERFETGKEQNKIDNAERMYGIDDAGDRWESKTGSVLALRAIAIARNVHRPDQIRSGDYDWIFRPGLAFSG